MLTTNAVHSVVAIKWLDFVSQQSHLHVAGASCKLVLLATLNCPMYFQVPIIRTGYIICTVLIYGVLYCSFSLQTALLFLSSFFCNGRYSLLISQLTQTVNQEALPSAYSLCCYGYNQLTNSITLLHCFLCSAKSTSFTQVVTGN